MLRIFVLIAILAIVTAFAPSRQALGRMGTCGASREAWPPIQTSADFSIQFVSICVVFCVLVGRFGLIMHI